MNTSREFAEYIQEQLEPVGDISLKNMFGGVLLETEGRQLGVVLHSTLYFKVTDADLQKEYQARDSKQFEYTRKDKDKPVVIKNWWSVPEDAVDDSGELTRLAEEVLDQEDI